MLHAFDALHPDKPLASYSVDAERAAELAGYFDSGAAVRAELFEQAAAKAARLNRLACRKRGLERKRKTGRPRVRARRDREERRKCRKRAKQ